MKSKLLSVLLVLGMVFTLVGCASQAEVASWNISDDADKFKVQRRLSVYDAATGQMVLQMEGLLSIRTDSNTNELTVMYKCGEDKFKKNFIFLSPLTMYIVEDLDGNDVDPYHYQITYNPQSIIPDYDLDIDLSHGLIPLD